MTIKSETQLKADLDAAGFRGVNKQEIYDLIDSKFAIGGAMSCRAVQMEFLTSNWEVFSAFTTSSDSKGITENLAEGSYSIDDLSSSGGDATGSYTTNFTAIVTTPIDMSLAFGIVQKGVLTDFRTPQMGFLAGVPRSITIFGGGSFPLAGQEMGVIINGDAGVIIDIDMAQFLVVRQ